MKYALLLIISLTASASFAIQTKPNIIFIMADDLGWGDVQCNNPEGLTPTPYINKLAAEGSTFTDAHTSASVCTPTRYGVLTGRYCWRTRLKKAVLWTTFDEPLIDENRLTVADLAKTAGYATACIGKWHLGMNFYDQNSDNFARGKVHHKKNFGGYKNVDFDRPAPYSPNDLGFDFSFISGAGHNMEPHAFIQNRMPVEKPTVWREAESPTTPGAQARESHEGWMSPSWSDENVDIEFTRQTVKFIKKCHTDKTPFFIYMTPVSPHHPWTPSATFKGKSPNVRGDFINQLDWCVGQITQTLDQLGLSDNTLIIVTSDNGPTGAGRGHKAAGPYRGSKGSLYEGGHRVPFIAKWPGMVKPGTVNDKRLCLTGLMMTLADIWGQRLPDNAAEDSFSFLPELQNKDSKHKNYSIVHQNYTGTLAITSGGWKYIPGKKKASLFNITEDPYEKKDVADQFPERVATLKALLEKIKSQGHTRL